MQAEKGQDDKSEKYSLRKELKRKRPDNQPIVKSPEIDQDTTNDLKPRKIFSPPTMQAPPAVGKSLAFYFKNCLNNGLLKS